MFCVKLPLVWNITAWKFWNITPKFHTFTIFVIFDTNVILNWMWGDTTFQMAPVHILNFQENTYTCIHTHTYKTCLTSCTRSPQFFWWLISKKLLSNSCVNTVNHSYEICGYIQKFVTFNLCNFHGVIVSS